MTYEYKSPIGDSQSITHNHDPDEGLVHLKDIQRQIGALRATLIVNSPKDRILKQASAHVRHQCLELEVKRDAMKRLIQEVNTTLSEVCE